MQKIWSILWIFVIAMAQNIKICCLISYKYGFKSYRDVWLILQFADIQFSPSQSKFCKFILRICFIKFLSYLNTSSNVWCKINLLFIIWRIHDELNLSALSKKNFSSYFRICSNLLYECQNISRSPSCTGVRLTQNKSYPGHTDTTQIITGLYWTGYTCFPPPKNLTGTPATT